MFHDTWIRRLSWLGSVALVMLSGAMLRAQDVFRAREVVVAQQPSGYWLGLVCDPADAALRSQLKLKDTGLVVREVVSDAPAAKAGIKQHDVIVRIGDKPVESLDQLVEAVNDSEGDEITLHVLREGQKTTVQATPTKRPEATALRNLPAEVREWFERRGLPAPGQPWKFGGMRPGVVTRNIDIVRRSHKLPKDMSVTITKKGEEPAKIVVEQGDKKWEVTEDKLEDLPEEVRKHVAPMLRGGAVFLPGGKSALDTDLLLRVPRGRSPRAEDRLQKQVEELQEQMEQLRKAIQGLTPPKES